MSRRSHKPKDYGLSFAVVESDHSTRPYGPPHTAGEELERLCLLHGCRVEGHLAFWRKYVRIETKMTDLEPFEANRAQVFGLRCFVWMEASGSGVRAIIDKARQMGWSTLCQLWLWTRAVTKDGARGLTIAHKQLPASELQEKQKGFRDFWPGEYAHLLPALDQKERGKKIRFVNRSLLLTESAEDKDAGRSGTFQHGHLTEFPLWPDAEETYTAMDPCIPPNRPGTSILIESTARGRNNFFYELWEQAEQGLNEFTPIFTPWYWADEYKDENRPRPGEPPLGEHPRIVELLKLYNHEGIHSELELLEKYGPDGLTEAHLYYYRDKLAKHKSKIGREYPWSAAESFAASETGYFDADILDWIDEECVIEPLYRGWFTETGFERALDGPWWLFEEPQTFAYYTEGSDPSEGLGRDSSFATIWNHSTGKQAASFQHNGLKPEVFADQVDWAGRYYKGADYGGCLLIPERNSGPGALVVNKLANEKHYPNIYVHERVDAVNHAMSTTYGWLTTEKSRDAMLTMLASKVHNRSWIVRCSRTAGEMRSFVFNERRNRYEAGHRATDDGVMASAMCSIARPWTPPGADDGPPPPPPPTPEFPLVGF